MTLSSLASSGRISLFEFDQITTFGHRLRPLHFASHAGTRSFPNGVPASILRGRKAILPSLLQPGPDNAQLHFPPHHQDPPNVALNPLSDASSALTQPLCPTVTVLHSPPILVIFKDSTYCGKKKHVACPARQMIVTVRRGVRSA